MNGKLIHENGQPAYQITFNLADHTGIIKGIYPPGNYILEWEDQSAIIKIRMASSSSSGVHETPFKVIKFN
jgi:hypothetical protein